MGMNMISHIKEITLTENMALNGIFGPDQEEVTRGWRKIDSKEFYKLFF
jgi:hypothetical protein